MTYEEYFDKEVFISGDINSILETMFSCDSLVCIDNLSLYKTSTRK